MQTEKIYQTTKEECLKLIEGVCEGCAGPLEPIETQDNAGNLTFWVGCMKCHCFRAGTKKKYWNIAEELVRKRIWEPYDTDDRPAKEEGDEWEHYLHSQCAGLCHKLRFIEGMMNDPLYCK